MCYYITPLTGEPMLPRNLRIGWSAHRRLVRPRFDKQTIVCVPVLFAIAVHPTLSLCKRNDSDVLSYAIWYSNIASYGDTTGLDS